MNLVSKLFLLLLSTLLLINIPSTAQEIKLSKIMGFPKVTSGPIIQFDGDVAGYYALHRIDDKVKGGKLYALRFYDQDLNAVKKHRIIGELQFAGGASNNEYLMFKFWDGDNDRFMYRVYDNKGELKTKKTSVLEGKRSVSSISIPTDAGANTSVFGVSNGFISYNYENPKKMKPRYVIEFFNPDAPTENWKMTPEPNKNTSQIGTFLTANDNILLSNITKPTGSREKEGLFSVLCNDLKTGKKIYETDITDVKYEIEILKAILEKDSNNAQVIGLYYPSGMNPLKGASIGIFSCKLDESGKISDKKFISWEKDVSKFTDVNEHGKREDGGFPHFHKVIKTNDGKIHLIAEEFRSGLSGLGLALNGSDSMTKIVIQDILVYTFSPDFTLEGIHVVSDNKIDIQLNANYPNTRTIAYILERLGYFNYNFTQIRNDGDNFTIGYLAEERIDKEKKFYFGFTSLQDGEWKEDKIHFEAKGTGHTLWLLPGKSGYILISDYDKKRRTLESRLEKINF